MDINVTDDALHIEVRREEKTEHKDKSGYRTEVRYGEFSRSIPLPLGVSQEGIGATYNDGGHRSPRQASGKVWHLPHEDPGVPERKPGQ